MEKGLKKGVFSYRKLLLPAVLLLAFLLRLYRFNQVPPSLFGDEVDTGYQAYSILKTGRDYFGNPWPLHFQSFGDWRMPLYVYLTVPFVALLGLTEVAVRLPSLLFSLGSIWLTYLVVKEIWPKKKIALLATLFLALSPWHFHFSRLGLEVSLFGFLLLAALLFFLRGRQPEEGRMLTWSGIFFGLGLYSYSTAKLFIPLLLLVLLVLFKKTLWSRKRFFSFVLPFLLVALPIGGATLFGQGGARFGNIAIFTDPTVAERVEIARRECPWQGNLERIHHNKLTVYGADFLKNYLQSFGADYLFIRGDPNLRHNPLERGQLQPILLPLILIGLVAVTNQVLKEKKPALFLPIIILLLTPIPAALTQNGGTHAIRTYQFLPWWQVLAAVGFVWLMSLFEPRRLKRIIAGFLITLWLISAASFLHYYLAHFPRKTGAWWRWWNYGYRDLFSLVNRIESDYDQIYLTPAHEPPIVYALFYHQYSPEKIQQEIEISPIGFGKFIFANPGLSFLKTGEEMTGKLFILTPGYLEAMGYRLEEYPQARILGQINYPQGDPAFYVFDTLR